MRLVFSSVASYSHLMPLVLPAAVAAKAAGHEVAVATAAEFTDDIVRAGLHPLPLPNLVGFNELKDRPDLAAELDLDMAVVMEEMGKRTLRAADGQFARMFAGPLAGIFATDMIEAMRNWKADLVVHESTEYGGYFAAEFLGLPHAVLDISPMAIYDEPGMLEQINKQRTALGLDEVDDAMHPFRYRRFGVAPEMFYPPEQRMPTSRYYRPASAADTAPLDPAIAELPGDRPLVLATLGSNAALVHGEERSVLDTIVEVLGDLPVTGVVALGQGISPDQWTGARPENVHLTSFVQQRLLLPACDAFITHCGFSGIREALSSGVPMVGLPLFAEQPENADRIRDLGVGVRMNVEDVTHESLLSATRAVLDDPGYRHRARQVQRAFLALPTFDGIVTDLERWAV